MDLYNLGKQPWADTQLIYHALAELDREGLILLSPATPYVCIGFHQDVEREVDLDFCRANAIPVFRRDVGGGAVYLDGNQLFFQLVLRRNDPRIPASKQVFYRRFLEPVINLYRRVGIPGRVQAHQRRHRRRPQNQRQRSGRDWQLRRFVGNVIVDFNCEMMARVLKVPDEKFRDKIHKTLKEKPIYHPSGTGRRRGRRVDRGSSQCLDDPGVQQAAGSFDPKAVDGALRAKMDELRPVMLSDSWLIQRRGRGAERNIKIRSGVHLVQKVHKSRAD